MDGYLCDRLDRLGPPQSGPTIACTIGRKPLQIEKGRNNHLYKGGMWIHLSKSIFPKLRYVCVILGVTALKILTSGDFIIGAGNGTVAQARLATVCKRGVPLETFQEYGSQMCVRGNVTSIMINSEDVLVGSTMSEIYYSKLGSLDGSKMLLSAHYSVVNDITFPNSYSEVFASCNYEDIRIWNSAAMRELVRINVANMTCHAVIFSRSGSMIISAWNDSHVRTYSVQSATPLWLIHHAHLRKSRDYKCAMHWILDYTVKYCRGCDSTRNYMWWSNSCNWR